MTCRERILAAIAHRPVSPVPTDMWATPELIRKLLDHFGIDARESQATPAVMLNGGRLECSPESIVELWRYLDIDGIFNVFPPYIGPALPEAAGIGYNEWGMGFRKQGYKDGEYLEQVIYPLENLQDVDRYRWPDPYWYDYNAIPALIERCGGRAINVGYTACFYYHNMLRGLEPSLTDPILEPGMTSHLIGKLSEFFHEFHRRCYEAASFLIDTTQVTDDFGAQQGLLISPKVFMQFYQEPMSKAINLAKSFGIYVFHHDDGDIRGIIPQLVEMGIDLLNPIQWRCGNWDLPALKREFGSKICFHSGVDNQVILPFGTAQDVRTEVKRLKSELGGDNTGFILCSSHNLQVNTPVENVVALYQEARNS
jgi:uroporphyrinogen decarboxylase